MKLGFLYAGQGSQHPGMGADLYEAYPAFRAVIDSAQVDFDLKEVSFTDSQGVINQTRYTQPCMVAFATGLTAVLREQGITPAVAAAARMTGFTFPSLPAGVVITISDTPATFAGMTSISTVEG